MAHLKPRPHIDKEVAGNENSGGESVMAERGLAEDAEWKLIQKNTFTRWVNEHLKKANTHVDNLETDLSDGLRLIALVEVLTKHKFQQVIKKPNFRTQKFENVTKVLKFLEEKEKLRLVNIDSSHIVDCNLKIILGLIWTLIMHYSISIPIYEGEAKKQTGPAVSGEVRKSKSEQTEQVEGPRQRLLNWIKMKIPQLPINNFTTDWNNGIAIGALVDACAPGLCPDWSLWEKNQALQNATEAMSSAEEWLDVPQLIHPEELTNPNVDEQSMMTYMSQFPNAKLKPGAPLRPRFDATRVRVFGPGVESLGNIIGKPCTFTIETAEAGRGKLDILVLDPKGAKEPCTITPNNDPAKSFTCTYKPMMTGQYRVIVKYGGFEVPHCPFGVKVEPPQGDSSKVVVSGPGIDRSATKRVDQRTSFQVDTKAAGTGEMECYIIDPHSRKDVIKPKITREGAGMYSVEYTPKEPGTHQIFLYFDGEKLPNAPYPIEVGSRVSQRAEAVAALLKFTDQTSSDFTTTLPDEVLLAAECTLKNDIEVDVMNCCHSNESHSPNAHYHSATNSCSSNDRSLEHFTAVVCDIIDAIADESCEPDTTTIGAPGLNSAAAYVTGRGVQSRGIRVQDQVSFQVHTEECGGIAPLTCSLVRSDGEAESVTCQQVDKFLWNCSYVPQRPGKYKLLAQYGGGDIMGSPFEIVIGPYRKTAITAFGPGLIAGVVNHPNIFTVCSQESGNKLTFSIEGPSEATMDSANNGDGSARVTYWVAQPGEYAVHIHYDGDDIQDSPYMPYIHPDKGEIKPDLMKIHGPIFSKTPLLVGQTSEFTVEGLADAIPTALYRSLGDNNLDSVLNVQCANDKGELVPLRFKRRADGSIVYSVTPKSSGVHTLYATVGHIPLKGVPFRIPVLSEPKLSEVKMWGPGLEDNVQRERTQFFIDPRGAFGANELTEGLAAFPVNVSITDSRNQQVPFDITKRPDGTYVVDYTTEPGISGLSIRPMLGTLPITTKPINVTSRPAFETSAIRVFDLESKVYVSSYVKFKVDTSSIDPKGNGELTAVLVDPGNERLACQVVNKKNGTYLCSYTPIEEGLHRIEISYEGVPIANSPFNIQVVPGCDPSRVKVYGPGLENGPHLCPGVEAEFTVDLTGVGQGGLGLSVEGPSEAPISCRDNRDGTCTVTYTPTEAGPHTIFVHFNDTEVPGGPFYVDVRSKVDPSQVHCYGPGLESGSLRAGWPAYFTVETKKAGDADLQVMYTPKPGAQMRPAHIQPLGTGAGKDLTQPPPYHKITYTPEAEGPCKIAVLYDGKHVPGSPYTVQVRKACEPERVRVHGKGVEGPITASFPVTFTVDAREAGMGDLTLALSDPKGQSIPVRVVPVGVDSESVITNGVVPSVTSLASGDVTDTGLLMCTYEPYLTGPHTIHVMFAGVEVENSPFTVECLPAGQAHLCAIKGEVPSFVQVDEEQVITVITRGDESARLTCQAIQPARNSNEAATLLPVETVDNKDGTVSVYYKPKQLGDLAMELRFGGQLITGGEFVQKIVSKSEFESRMQNETPAYRPVEFRLPAPKGEAEIEALVLKPSGAQETVTPNINNDNTISVAYNPSEQGMHELHVNCIRPGSSGGSMPLQGSPYRFYVDSLNTGRVTAYGPGLSHGTTNIPAEFTIMAQEAGGGGLSLSVEGPSKAEISCKENKDGTCDVSYLPLVPGRYTITIKFLDQHIPGSPFVAKITGDPMQRAHLNMGAQSNIALDAMAEDITTLTASVVSSTGREESCVLKQLPNNRLSISFTPKEVGEHLISVYQAGRHIAESPFRIFISEKELGDPSRVRVTGQGLISGKVNQPNLFTVDTRDAGYAGLSLTIEGPSKPEMECQDNLNGTCSVSYTPTEPGIYVIKVKYADADVPNSPFYVSIEGDASSKITERITRHREATSVTTVGSRCEMSLRVADTNPRDMTASVMAPSGQLVPCELVPIESDHYNIKFVPQEMGEHLVRVKHKGVNIPGSPFQFTVGPIRDGVAGKVRAAGSGLQEGVANAPNEFTVYTREAGAGTLAVAIEGPSKADIECEEKPDGSSLISYQVALPGVYTCSLKFNDEHVPHSPFRITVKDGHDRVSSYPLQSSQHGPGSMMSSPAPSSGQMPLGSSVAFTVHHAEKPDEVLRAKVYSPSGLIEEATVQSIDRDQFAVRFMPTESGPHFVHVHSVPMSMARKPDVKLGPDSPFRPIQGSPFRLVISRDTADPGMVYATGEGLRHGKVDHKNTFFVNTVKAGSGALNVTVDGPSKVTLIPEEHDEGYSFSYVPTLPGTYEISIKYGGNFHIAGSPFKAKVTGSGYGSRASEQSQITLETVDKTSTDFRRSDVHGRTSGANADLVRCEGLGLKRADNERENHFTVDTTGAGSEALLVGICGPTRPFEEIKVQHVTGDKYSVSYRVQEHGRHLLFVKWGDQHVPGSPFVVDVP